MRRRSVPPHHAALREDVAQAVDVQAECPGFQALARPVFLREPLVDRGDDSLGRVARHHHDAVGVADDDVARGDGRAGADDRDIEQLCNPAV